MGPKALNPETAERINKEDVPIQTLNVDRDKMILFSFIKHAVLGRRNRETQPGPTHNLNHHIGDTGPEPPTQHKPTTSREHTEEPETEIGSVCFEPSTALLLQDPLNQDTYDPGQALSRPIGSLQYGDTFLAERHGSDGQGTFSYLSKVTCVMLFEIPQDKDPDANKIIQESTLSAGLGVTLTKHLHIRKYGRIHQNSQGKWHLTNRARSLEWKVAADLGRDTSRSRNPHITPVTRVVNLVLEPPGNVVILTPSNDLYISASLGYHMRHEKGVEGSSAPAGGIPVYTQRGHRSVRSTRIFPRYHSLETGSGHSNPRRPPSI